MWRYALALVVLSGAGGWYLTGSERVAPEALPEHTPDAVAGERIYHAAGCSSCHATPGAKGDDKLLLSGGLRLKTEFGTFVVPNISPDPTAGIGNWSEADFVSAVMKGTAPDGRHYYPAFPYTSYARMRPEDVRDLFAYLRTLPKSDRASEPHEIGFPFSINRGLGVWKLLNLDPAPATAGGDEQVARGRYLAEGPGHCGECHTPRDFIGGLDLSRWLGGAPNPEGEGKIPNITPGGLDWSAADIAYYLESGFTPDFDTAGGQMVAVVDNMARLPAADREAIAAYLKSVPAVAAR